MAKPKKSKKSDNSEARAGFFASRRKSKNWNTNMPGRGGNYFQDGAYLVKIGDIKAGQSKKGAGDYVAIEGTILEVLQEMPGSNQPGQAVTNTLMLDKHLSAPGDWRNFVTAAFELDPASEDAEDEWVEYADKAIGARRPLFGQYLVAEVTTKPTQSGGKFTRVYWMTTERWGELAEDDDSEEEDE